MSGIWAILPVKGFGRGKSRLGEGLADEERAALARRLFERVSKILIDEPRMMGLVVVTDDHEVRSRALELGAGVLPDPEGAKGLGPVVDAGVSAVEQLGAVRALVCMSDLPRLTADELGAMLDAMEEAEMVIAPDREGMGTNALGLHLPFDAATCFGNVDSAKRHLRLGEKWGLSHRLLELPGLAFDLDGPEALAELGDEWRQATR